MHDHDQDQDQNLDLDDAEALSEDVLVDEVEDPRAAAVAAVTAERDRLKDQLLRTAADFDNFRKRSKREVDEARRRGKEDTLRELLPALDNLERALEATTNATEVGAVAEGVRLVLRGFEDVANKLGLVRMQAKGEPFDPNEHDAIQQQETDEVPPGTVVAEVVPGYKLGDRLLRAAMVVVARPAPKE